MIWKRLLFLFFVTTSCFLSSCVPRAKLVYLQKDGEIVNSERSFSYTITAYKLQENDILDVQVRSANPEANALFNLSLPETNNNQSVQAVQAGDAFYLSGYSIDEDGMLDLPVIGKIKAVGLTLAQIEADIRKVVENYFEAYYLKVQLGGIRFSALGEFKVPGKFNVLQNQLTIFEAIAQAGDLTDLASRSSLKLIRQFPGETKVFNLDLLDEKIISSPYYFIHPNDVLYAEPLPQKSNGIGTNGTQTFTTVLSVVASAVTIILAIQNLN